MKLGNICSPIISGILKDTREGNIQSNGYSPHVFSAAIHFVNTSSTFDEMLERAIDFSGEENYCAVLSGSLGGARWGSSSISDLWFAGIKDVDRVKSAASNLASEW